ncbi:MAG: GDP-mannose 4,6-dehydratase [Patescibacteria group bacterium]
MKSALVTGITGQDGSYLAEFLLNKGYQVMGVVRRSSSINTERIDHILKDLHSKGVVLFRDYGDLADSHSLSRFIDGNVESYNRYGSYEFKFPPDEIYNLGAQSHVRISFDMPEYTANVTGLGTLRLLELVRNHEARNPNSKIKFYQASSSEMFGFSPPPQNEQTVFHPRSPYGCAKAFAYHTVINYRESYNIFAANGILFNHESPRRGINFVTRKIVRAVAEIKRGRMEKLHLGNLDAKRDWGYAPEYVEAMWLMLQQPEADDYVIATGENHSVREFAERAFKYAGIDIVWQDQGLLEKGLDKKTGKVLVEIDPDYFRPAEVHDLRGDYTKAKAKLGWNPKTKFDDLVALMMEHELKGGAK